MAPYRSWLSIQELPICKPTLVKASLCAWDRAGDSIRRLGDVIDPEVNCIPRTRTVVAALISLTIFFFSGGLFIRYPSRVWLPIAYFVAALLDLVIAAFAWSDLNLRRK